MTENETLLVRWFREDFGFSWDDEKILAHLHSTLATWYFEAPIPELEGWHTNSWPTSPQKIMADVLRSKQRNR